MASKMVLDALGFNPARSSSFGDAVQNVAVLAAILSSQVDDKQLRLVEDEGRIYRYDAQSTTSADGIKIVIPSNLKGTDAGRWILQSVTDHALLTNLSNDDHKQYVHQAIARVISAIHTFNPSAAGVPFVLGANAIGQKVVGLNADQLDGKSIEDLVLASLIGAPGGIASLGTDGKVLPTELLKLANGMPAYNDPISGNLISIASLAANFSIATTGTRNVYLNFTGDIASNTVGYHLPRNAMITSITVASSTTMGSNTGCSFQVRKNGSTTALGTYAIPSGASNKAYTGLNILLSAGDALQTYVAASSNIANPCITVELVWRD